MGRLLLLAASAAAAAPAGDARTAHSLADVHWDYRSAFDWKNLPGFAECGGARQSPIALEARSAEAASPGFWKLWIPRKPPTPLRMENNGHSVKLDMTSRGITLTSSALQSQYTLAQMHWHVPSEHVVEGKRYPLERHMVFTPSDVLALHEAGITRYPLVVIGELYRIGETGDDTLERVADALSSIPNAGDSTYLNFFPTFSFQTDEFFTYQGSLTTPPCSEVVHWHVSARIHVASNDQITKMRDIVGRMATSAAPLGVPTTAPAGWQVYAGNARPIQPANERCVPRGNPTSNCTMPPKLRVFYSAM